jgi:NAD(P)-dependent dehydrogenase (short-subunit alcohol dehydrogenase family)
MTNTLQGRAAIITGANQGLGLAIARAYVEAGADVLMCARDAELLEQARAQVSALAASGQIVAAQVADVSKSADVERLAATAFQTFPRDRKSVV